MEHSAATQPFGFTYLMSAKQCLSSLHIWSKLENRKISIRAFTFCAFFISACASATDFSSVPPSLVGNVVDQANVFSSLQKAILSASLTKFEKETCHQIAVLTVDSTLGEPINIYSQKVANAWGLGYKNIDNGVLLVLAVKDRSTRIAVGKGFKDVLPDNAAKTIIEQDMVPQFRIGNYAGGLQLATESIERAVKTKVIENSQRPPNCRT